MIIIFVAKYLIIIFTLMDILILNAFVKMLIFDKYSHSSVVGKRIEYQLDR